MSVLPPYTVTVIALEASGGILWGFSPGEIIAAASVAIAIIALVVSIRESRKTQEHNLRESQRMQKHNRLSVKPLLDIMLKTRPGEEEGTSEIHIDLINAGVGPAIIKRYSVFFDDKEIVVSDDDENAKKEIASLITSELSNVRRHIIGAPTSIIARGRQVLLHVEIMGLKKNVQAFGNRLGFKIDYQSIYESELFVFEHRNSSGYPKDKSPTQENQKG